MIGEVKIHFFHLNGVILLTKQKRTVSTAYFILDTLRTDLWNQGKAETD